MYRATMPAWTRTDQFLGRTSKGFSLTRMPSNQDLGPGSVANPEMLEKNSIMRVVSHPQVQQNVNNHNIFHLFEAHYEAVQKIRTGIDVIVNIPHDMGKTLHCIPA
jgi:hypothetical protein